jgi:hypothetical protein
VKGKSKEDKAILESLQEEMVDLIIQVFNRYKE